MPIGSGRAQQGGKTIPQDSGEQHPPGHARAVRELIRAAPHKQRENGGGAQAVGQDGGQLERHPGNRQEEGQAGQGQHQAAPHQAQRRPGLHQARGRQASPDHSHQEHARHRGGKLQVHPQVRLEVLGQPVGEAQVRPDAEEDQAGGQPHPAAGQHAGQRPAGCRSRSRLRQRPAGSQEQQQGQARRLGGPAPPAPACRGRTLAQTSSGRSAAHGERTWSAWLAAAGPALGIQVQQVGLAHHASPGCRTGSAGKERQDPALGASHRPPGPRTASRATPAYRQPARQPVGGQPRGRCRTTNPVTAW
jgi:hypothetical protein